MAQVSLMLTGTRAMLACVLLSGLGLVIARGAGAAASAANVPSCSPAQLRVSLGAPHSTSDATYYSVVFTNRGHACAIWGVPRIQPESPRRRRLGPPARNTSIGMFPVRHVVGTNGSVSVTMGVADTGNYPASTCRARRAVSIVVSLRPFVTPVRRALVISVCTRQASLSTRLIAPGRGA